MFGVLLVERALDQPAATLQRGQEVSLVLVNDVHNLKAQRPLVVSAQNFSHGHFLSGRLNRQTVATHNNLRES